MIIISIVDEGGVMGMRRTSRLYVSQGPTSKQTKWRSEDGLQSKCRRRIEEAIIE